MQFAIVVAAGQGRRMGFKKQFIDLAGQPMWLRSVNAMMAAGAEQVIVVAAKEDAGTMQESLGAALAIDGCRIIIGGSTRHASVTAGMRDVLMDVKTRGVALEDVIVAVHDAARPFVSPGDVARLYEHARGTGAAILGRACRDTVKRVHRHMVSETVPRENLFLAETPQVIRGDIIERAYFEEQEEIAPTDDSALLESLGIPVMCVESTSFNGKVTTPDDLEYAYWLANKTWGGDNA